MIIPGVEGDDNLPVPSLTQSDAVAVVGILEEWHLEPCQRVAPPEGVGHAVLAPGVDLGDHEDVIEQKYLSLVLTWKC